MFRKLLSIVIASAMLFTLLPSAAFADGAEQVPELIYNEMTTNVTQFGGGYYDPDGTKRVTVTDGSAPADIYYQHTCSAVGNTGIRMGQRFQVSEGDIILAAYWVRAEYSAEAPKIQAYFQYTKDANSGGAITADYGYDTIESGKWYRRFHLCEADRTTTGLTTGADTGLRFALGSGKLAGQVTQLGDLEIWRFPSDFAYGGKTGAEAVEAYVGDTSLSAIYNNGTILSDFDPDTKTYYVPEADYGTITAEAPGMYADVSIDTSDESKAVITVKAYPAAFDSQTEYGAETETVYTVIKGEKPSESDKPYTDLDDISSMVFYGGAFYDSEKSLKSVDVTGSDSPVSTAVKYVGKAVPENDSNGGGIRSIQPGFQITEANSVVLVSYWVKAEMSDGSSEKPVVGGRLRYIKEDLSKSGAGVNDLDGNVKYTLPEAGKWYKLHHVFKVTQPTGSGDTTALRFELGCSSILNQVTYFGGYEAKLFPSDFTYGGYDEAAEAVVAYAGNNKLSAICNDGTLIDGFDPDTYEYSIPEAEFGEITAEAMDENAEVTVDASDSTKVTVTVSQDYCYNDGNPCEFGKTTERVYTINKASGSQPPVGGDDDDPVDGDDTNYDEPELTPVDDMSSLVFFGGLYYDTEKSLKDVQITDENAPVTTAMKYVAKAEASANNASGIRGASTDFKVSEANSYILVTYWAKAEMADSSSAKPVLSSKLCYIKADGTSSYGEIFDIDGNDDIELPEADKWYKIYNIFKIENPTSGGDMSALRFVLGCTQSINQITYLGDYKAYHFPADFSYNGESEPEKAIISYIQDPKAKEISYKGEPLDGYNPENVSYIMESDGEIASGDITADISDFAVYGVTVSGSDVSVKVQTHAFDVPNENGVYSNSGEYKIKTVSSSGISIKSTALKNVSGAAAETLTKGDYTLTVQLENKLGKTGAKLFTVLYDEASEKQINLDITDIEAAKSSYDIAVNVPSDGSCRLSVFAVDGTDTLVPLTDSVTVAASGAQAPAGGIKSDSIKAVQNFETNMIDAGAQLGDPYALRTLVLAAKKGAQISEDTIAYAAVVKSANDGSLGFSFIPETDGEYTLYLCDMLSGKIISCDFDYYSEAAIKNALAWFETASASDVEDVFSAEDGKIQDVSVRALIGEDYETYLSLDDKSGVAKALAGKTFADYSEFKTVFDAAFEESLICMLFKNASASDLDELVGEYGEKIGLNTDDEYGYNAFNDSQKKSLADALEDMKFASTSELAEAFNRAIVVEVFNSYSWGKLEGAFEAFDEYLDVSMTAFNKLSSTKQANVLKNLAAQTFKDPDDIGKKFGDLVEDEKSAGSSGGGGGGGSSSGYDSAYTVSPNVIPAPDTAPQYTPGSMFIDVPYSHWANSYVESLGSAGIVSGDGNGYFYPERNLTRAEYVKMIVLALGLFDSDAKSDFTDCQSGAWYDSYVASGVNAGIVTGMGDGTFRPESTITRQDMATIAYRCLIASGKAVPEISGGEFSDDAQIASYAYDAVYAMKSMNIINGMGDNTFAPESLATRAMASKVIALLMQA